MTPLKKIRLKRQLTQAEIATPLGITQSHFSRIENGEVCAADVAARIAHLFGHEVTEMQILYPKRYTQLEMGN